MDNRQGKATAKAGGRGEAVQPRLQWPTTGWAEVPGLPAPWQPNKRMVHVDTTADRTTCRKCGKKGHVYRHHKGFDSFTGQYNKGIGVNYSRYLDCVAICEDCHCEIHFIYEPYVDAWHMRTPRGASAFRKKLIGICDDWLAGLIKSPSVPKSYRKNFHKGLVLWRRKGK